MLGLGVSAVMTAAPFTAVAAADAPDFAVSAEFHAGKAAGTGEVAVTFAPRDAEVRINAIPAPRLKLDPGQKLLAEKAGARPNLGPATDKYVDTTFPVVFPVAVLGRPRGERSVKASLVYYYCSHREGWCRKGTSDFEIPLKAR